MTTTTTTSSSSTISLLDARSDSLLITWPTTTTDGSGGGAGADGVRYVLEYKFSGSTNDSNDNSDGNGNGNGNEFIELSSKLTQPQVRKRNLQPNTKYWFRVAPVSSSNEQQHQQHKQQGTEWITTPQPFLTLSKEQEAQSMDAPTVSPSGNQAVVVSWKAKRQKESGAVGGGYEIQMRENVGGVGWTTIATNFSSPTMQVRKKNLTSKAGYQFRIRPSSSSSSSSSSASTSADNSPLPFSPPSEIIVAPTLSEPMKRWFSSLDDGNLVRNHDGNNSNNNNKVSLADALAGTEFVLLYASASWCGPCRQFSPQLKNWYHAINSSNGKKTVEVVFLSADHDERSFLQYFKTMPWLAVDYDDDTREMLMGRIKVTGIPRLVVLSTKTGKIVVDNAVGQPLDVTKWRTMDT